MKSKLALLVALYSIMDVTLADELLFTDQDMPVVLSATRLKQAVADAPASISIIDRQMIQQTGVRELPELLRLVPGMVVGYEKGWDAFVSYHGLSADIARRMQVLVDGRSVYQPSLAFVDWIGLPLELDDIDRIEVVRGPNAAAYGANSFLGVVNIITRTPADLPRLRAYSRNGADGIRDNFASASGVKNGLSWQISANSRRDEGFSTYFDNHDANDNRTPGYTNRYPYLDDKRQKSVYGQMEWELAPESSINLSAGHSELVGGNMRSGGIVDFLDPPDLESSQDFFNLSAEHAFAAHQLKLQTDYSRFTSKQHLRVRTRPAYFLPELRQMFVINRVYTDKFFDLVDATLSGADDEKLAAINKRMNELAGNDKDELDMLQARIACSIGSLDGDICDSLQVVADPGLLDEINYTSDIDMNESRLEAELQDTWTISPTLRMVYGVGIQNSDADSLHYFNGNVENTVWRVFAHGEWQFRPDWRLNVGIMDEHDDYAGHLQSPRIALNWRFAPSHSLRLVESRAYRTPDLRESKAYWQYYGQAEDRSLSRYDGYFPYLGQAPTPEGQTCVFSRSYDDGTLVCTNGAPSERIVSHEIGYYGELPKQHLQLDIRLFRDDLRLSEHNLQVEDFVIAPLVKHEQRGVELSGQWRPYPSWRFLLNYAYDDITITDDNSDFVPKHSGNVAAWYDGGMGIQSSLSYVFYNQLYNDSGDGGLYFDRLDWRLAKKWSLTKQNDIEVSGVWQIRLTEDTELRRSNGAPRDKVWLQLSYMYD